jgi:tetratricopeptide (TPR) repeat protein
VERTLARAEAAIARSPVRDHEWAASIRWTDRATAFYREFLAGDRTLPWAAAVNARVKEHLLRQLRKIGHVWEEIGDWEEAAQCYERAVAINDAAEEFYRRLMLAYEKLDRWGDAILDCERCRKALAWLGTSPSPETEAAVSRLKHPENKKG